MLEPGQKAIVLGRGALLMLDLPEMNGQTGFIEYLFP